MLRAINWRIRDLRIPPRLRAQAELWRGMLEPGSLVFDVGANRGDMTRSLLLAGAGHVVAVEPQPRLASLLRARFPRRQVSVFEGVLSEPGRRSATLRFGDAHVLASVDSEFIERTGSGRFQRHRWTESREVVSSTWDELTAIHGKPSFAKIDVEGHEESVLKGMSVAPERGLCVEVMSELRHRLPSLVGRLAEAGLDVFNLSGEASFRLGTERWLGPREAIDRFGRELESDGSWGDLYAMRSSAVISGGVRESAG